MNIKEFTRNSLESPSEYFEEQFRELNYENQIYFVLCMIEIFKTWTVEDFKKFQETNSPKIIFDNLTDDAMDFFLRHIPLENDKEFPETNWAYIFCYNIGPVIKHERNRYYAEKNSFNDYQIKNRK